MTVTTSALEVPQPGSVTSVTMDTTIVFSKNDGRDVELYVNLVNPSDNVVLVEISAPGVPTFTTRHQLVEAKNVSVTKVTTTNFEIDGTGKSAKSILIRSNDTDLIVIGLSAALNSGDMFFARNATQLGTEYFIITYCDIDRICQFAITATEDNTLIEVTFPGYFVPSDVFIGTNYSPGEVISMTLEKSQTFQIQSMSDLSGVKILSTNGKRFSVLSGCVFTRVQNGYNRDHLADIVPPIAAWGTDYIIVRRRVTEFEREYVKIGTADDGANVSIFGCGSTVYQHIPDSQTFLYNLTCQRIHVRSDVPVLVAHFPVAVPNGDPAMFFPTPISQYVSEYAVYIPPGFKNCALALVMETVHTLTFDLAKFSSQFNNWKEIQNSVYSTAWLKRLHSGVVEIHHTSPFGGHVICEQEISMTALTIGLGNVTLNEPQLYSSTTDTDGSTTETLTQTMTTETFPSTSFHPDVTSARNVSSTTTAAVDGKKGLLNCSCCKTLPTSDPPSREQLLAMMNKIKNSLRVSKKATSHYLRTLNSAWDERTSSASIGAVGIIVICVVFGSIIAMDLATLYQNRR
ncbi:uncharacterized protein LOC132555068 [Ylistrum balloti]|uniref:uncharacterized protein LOC132555068 n=1 Tax=Ylistrum balloti TaxID=509963 RepID=UPI002905EF5A|nr:uncharacterized protein LOC132555068 [Ylistrum balloti]